MKRSLFTFLCSTLFVSQLFAQATVSTLVDTSAFTFSDDLIFDAYGNLFGADYSGDAVFKRTPDGTVTEFINGLNTPNGLAFDSNGDLFVCDNIGNRIYKVSPTGVFLDTFQVTYPSGIIKDAASDTMIFTTYGATSELKKLAPDGTVLDFHAGSPLNGPVGLEYCNGVLYTANFSDRRIFRVEADTLIFIAQLPGSGSLGFLATVDGKLMATAFQGQKIYRVDPILQTVEVYAGSTTGYVDGSIDTAKFTSPNGIVANSTGDTLYVSEYSSGRLRMITGYTLHTPEIAALVPMKLWPVPAQNTLNIAVDPTIIPCTVTLHTIDGKKLTTMELNSSGHALDVSEFSPGVLIVRVDAAGKGSWTERVVKD